MSVSESQKVEKESANGGGKKYRPLQVGSLWRNLSVEWRFFRMLCASVPADPELVKQWLEAWEPSVRPPGARSIDEIAEEIFTRLPNDTVEVAEQEQDKKLLVFERVEQQLVVRSGTIRAHIKECARTLSAHIGSIKGERAFSTRVINGVYFDAHDYYIPILNSAGEPAMKADGILNRPIHVRTPRGEISALKAFEYVREPVLRFRLKLLGDSVPIEDMETLFRLGSNHGYGGERGAGEGRYTFTIKEEEANG